MALKIPNEADAGNEKQSRFDRWDFEIGNLVDGVISGCAVTAQGTPNNTVAVASGTVQIGNAKVTVGSGNVTITAADVTNDRFDFIVVNNAGVKSATAGIAAVNPVFPDPPANSVVLAAVFVPANESPVIVVAGDIVDKRSFLRLQEHGHTGAGDGGQLRVSKSYIFEYPTTDLALDDFIPQNSIRVPIAGKHGAIVLGTAYARCEVIGSGTNTILIETSTTLTGARTTRGTINLGVAREADTGAMAFTVSDGMYLWVRCSAVGATAPQKVTVQIDAEESVY